MSIRFGLAGIGPVRDIEKTFAEFAGVGIRAAEISFTHGTYIKKKEDALKVKRAAKKFGIQLSIHAPYWINLNSDDLGKVKASKQRILKACEVGDWIGAKKVIFHCGYFMKKEKSGSYENIKNRIIEMQEEANKHKWKVTLCPETMGKINVFGGVEEISQLVKDTDCGFCLDFAHILARDKKINWEKIEKLFPQKNWHCHFSGIEYGEKGERNHIKTREKYWEWLLKHLPKNKNITVINEAPTPFEDAVRGLKVLRSMNK
ncbi:endonuclease IV [Candidatus Pacearchaeota archaeon]|nr:endonuclease IV [Candidatus Pacearchaeota archaeon]